MNRRIIGVLLAVLLAVLGTSAVLLYVQRTKQNVAEGQQAVHVLVAKSRIPAGTSGSRIRSAGLTKDTVMPRSSLPDGYLTALTVDLDKLVVTADVLPDQLVLKSMFGQSDKFSGGLAIPDGMMAVTVPLRESADVAQYVRPGSQVAVFAYYSVTDTTTQRTTTDSPHATAVILPKVTVLAVGSYGSNGQTASQAQDQAPLSGGSGVTGGSNTLHQTTGSIEVTVAVNQADATRLIHMAEGAELYLALLTDSSQVQPGQGLNDKNAAP